MTTVDYLYKLYDTINVKNNKVGLGIETADALLHVNGMSLFNQIGSTTSNINFTGTTLSNIDRVLAQTFNVNSLSGDGIVVNYITTDSVTSNINVSGKSLSNITTASVMNLTADGAHINVSGKSLSNVNTTYTEFLSATAGHIGVNGKSLSNVNTTYTEFLSATASHIGVNGKSLSNVNTTFTEFLTATADNIGVSGKSLSNVNTTYTEFLSATANHIGVNGKSLSNVNTTFTEFLTATAGHIGVSGKSLSNVNTTYTEFLSATASHIGVNAKSLSNVNTTFTEFLTATADNIGVSGKSLSNVNTTFTEHLSATASYIGFNGKSLSNVNNILANSATFNGTITASNLNVIGDYTVLNTTTSNTEQMIISNLGTGPALRVTQSGIGSQFSVAEFIDADDGIALKIADTGLIGINTNTPSQRLDAYDTAAIQAYFHTDAAGAAQVKLENSGGYLLMGPSASSTVDVIATSAQPLRIGTNSTETIRILSGGNVGVGTTAAEYKLDIAGKVGVRNAFYVKNGGMNVITFSHGNQAFSSSGSHSLGFTLGWANTISDHKYAFRVCVRFHIASTNGAAAYRRLEAIVTPKDDNANGAPKQLVVTEMADTNGTDFTGLGHTIVRNTGNAVDLAITWTANTNNASFGNMEIEVFASTDLGDFTFTPTSS